MNTVSMVQNVVVFTTSEGQLQIPKEAAEVIWQGQDIGYLAPFLYPQKDWLRRNPQMLIWDIDEETRYGFRQEELQGFVQVNKLMTEKPMLTLLVPEVGGSHIRTTFHGGQAIEYRQRGIFLHFERYTMYAASGHVFQTAQPSFLDEETAG